jgi:hypothetical protein
MRIRTMALAGALLGSAALFASAAYADDPMVNTYGNTVITTDEATGATSKLLFNKDNTYTGEATGKDGKPVTYTGAWSLKDGGKTICLAPNVPEGTQAPPAACTPLEKHNVGDSWKVTNDKKQSYDVSIKAGR